MRSHLLAFILAIAVALICVGIITASSAAASSSAAPSPHHHDRHLLHTRTSSPREWIRASRSDVSTIISFSIALRQHNLDELESLFWRVSNPRHEEYGQFKSIEEIHSLIAPKAEEVNQVHSWLNSHGIQSSEFISNADAIQVKTTVDRVESLLHTKFFDFHHIESKMKLSRAFGEYTIPMHLKHLIVMIEGVSSFPIPHFKVDQHHHHATPLSGDVISSHVKKSDVTVFAAAAPLNLMLPQGIYQAYNITQTENGTPNVNSSVGVIQFLAGETASYSPNDLAQFGKRANLPILPVQHVVGPNNASDPAPEATLDIQMIASVNLAGDSWFWTQPQPDSWLYSFSLSFFNTADVPLIISLSYGWAESDQCFPDHGECNLLGVNSEVYVERVNIEFQKIGLRGISILAASGDDGVHNRDLDPQCKQLTFYPQFPASSSFVTSVGATEFINTIPVKNGPLACSNPAINCVGGGYEQAVSYNVSRFASGGGFSSIIPRPTFQDSAVTQYLQSGVTLPPSYYYNQLGRAFPDISIVGSSIVVVVNGQAMPTGGTSASAPILAAMFSLINSELMSAGRPQLGPLNQLLYQMSADDAATLTDITTGDNRCMMTGCPSSCQGFEAREGWDPVTGLGTPIYPAMLSYIMNLPQ